MNEIYFCKTISLSSNLVKKIVGVSYFGVSTTPTTKTHKNAVINNFIILILNVNEIYFCEKISLSSNLVKKIVGVSYFGVST